MRFGRAYRQDQYSSELGSGLPGQTPRRRFKAWPIILFGLYALYYYTSNSQTVEMTGRTQLVDMSREQEAALGLQSYQQILSQSEVVSSGPEVETIRKIGERLARVVDAQNFEWEFNLINSPQANAFALPGGKVAVYSGLLPVAANEDGLAVVMGHEIAHAIARHGAERMAQQRLQQIGSIAINMSVSDMDLTARRMVMGAFGLGSQFGLLLPFSRKHESEADYMGLLFMARACYNPEEAPKLWERMAKASSGRAPAEFMSTHPNPETRIEQFQSWMELARIERSKHCSGS